MIYIFYKGVKKYLSRRINSGELEPILVNFGTFSSESTIYQKIK